MNASAVTAYLGLGGNLGDPAAAMAEALGAIDADPATRVAAVSSLYKTPPWGKTDQPDFLNAVAGIVTTRLPRDLLALCLAAEKALKRVRRERWGPRTIDIDILLYGAMEVNEAGLEIPHPRMAERAFVLVPLAEIAPGLSIGGRPVLERIAMLDRSGIERVSRDGEWWRGATAKGS
jgi:2-amino-4-hydroxy-6-hydroxymethyldihydropteridine diphosphokinase